MGKKAKARDKERKKLAALEAAAAVEAAAPVITLV